MGRALRFMVRPNLMVGRLRMGGARTGEKCFAPTHAARGYIGRAPRFMAWRCLMVGRLRMGGARTGEIFFAPTDAVRGYIGAGATIWGAAMFDGWAMAHQWRTDGRKMFRPYIHPSCSRPGARLMGAMVPSFLGSRKLSESHCAGLLMM